MNEMERVNLVFIVLRNGLEELLNDNNYTGRQRDILYHLREVAENNVLFEVETV